MFQEKVFKGEGVNQSFEDTILMTFICFEMEEIFKLRTLTFVRSQLIQLEFQILNQSLKKKNNRFLFNAVYNSLKIDNTFMRKLIDFLKIPIIKNLFYSKKKISNEILYIVLCILCHYCNWEIINIRNILISVGTCHPRIYILNEL